MRVFAALIAVMAFQFAWMPPFPLVRGISLCSGVRTGTRNFAGNSRSYIVRPVVAEPDWVKVEFLMSSAGLAFFRLSRSPSRSLAMSVVGFMVDVSVRVAMRRRVVGCVAAQATHATPAAPG